MFYCTIISVAVVFMIWSLGHAFGIVNWMSDPGKLMGVIAGSANGPFDFKAGISKYMLCFIFVVWFGNWIIVKKGISAGNRKMFKNIYTATYGIDVIIYDKFFKIKRSCSRS